MKMIKIFVLTVCINALALASVVPPITPEPASSPQTPSPTAPATSSPITTTSPIQQLEKELEISQKMALNFGKNIVKLQYVLKGI